MISNYNQNCELGIFFSKTEGHQRTPYAFLVFFKLVFLCPPVSSIYSTGVTVKCNCLCFYGIYTCAIHELPRKILQVSNAQCLKMTEMSKKTFLLFFIFFFYTWSKYKVLIWFLVPKSKFFVEGIFFCWSSQSSDRRESINKSNVFHMSTVEWLQQMFYISKHKVSTNKLTVQRKVKDKKFETFQT